VKKGTVVVNAKALFHLLPDLIPPIDRRYTIRFFRSPPKAWKDKNGKLRNESLPQNKSEQFVLFHETCLRMKRLADRLNPRLFEAARRDNDVSAPKALDNAIVNYVRMIGKAAAD